MNQFENSISKLSSYATGAIVLGGDFNLPGWDWASETIKPKCSRVDIHNRVKEIFCDNNLMQLVKEPTRETNTLDLLVTNNPTLINRTQVLPGISDHDVVFTEIDVSPKKNVQKPRKIPLYKKADWERLNHHCQGLLDDIINNEDK